MCVLTVKWIRTKRKAGSNGYIIFWRLLVWSTRRVENDGVELRVFVLRRGLRYSERRLQWKRSDGKDCCKLYLNIRTKDSMVIQTAGSSETSLWRLCEPHERVELRSFVKLIHISTDYSILKVRIRSLLCRHYNIVSKMCTSQIHTLTCFRLHWHLTVSFNVTTS